MKLARFEAGNRVYYGEVRDGEVFVLEGDIYGNYTQKGDKYNLDQVKLLAPVIPGKIICIGMNYLSHILEIRDKVPIPEEPVIFMVSPTAVIGPDEPIILPYPENVVQHEAELAVVIGREGRDIPVEQAARHILGYTCGNDVSDRILQKKDGQFCRAKSFHTFKPLGQYIVTGLDPRNCRVQCRVNGELRQDGHTRDLIKDVYNLVSYISEIMTLYPGDVIMTGTPAGV